MMVVLVYEIRLHAKSDFFSREPRSVTELQSFFRLSILISQRNRLNVEL